MIRVEPAPDVSVRAHGGAGKQPSGGDDLFAALLALIGGAAAPLQTLTVTTAPDAKGDGKTAGKTDGKTDGVEALPVTGATLAAALGAVDAKAVGLTKTGTDAATDGTAAIDATAAAAGKATGLPPGLAPTGPARADTPAGDRSHGPEHTAAGDHAAVAAADPGAKPAADKALAAGAAAPRPDAAPAAHRPVLPDNAAAAAVTATSAAQGPAESQRVDGPAPAAYVSELPSAVTEAAARLRPHGGAMRLSVRLDPPNVGTVMISLHMLNDHVRLVMHAPDGGGAEALQQQKHLVEAALSAEGLNLEEFRVDVGGGWNGTPADSSPQGQGEQQRRAARGNVESASFAAGDAVSASPRAKSGVWL